MSQNTPPVTGLALTTSGTALGLAAPRTIKDLMGAPTTDTLINFMKYARRSHLTVQKNEVSTRLGGLHKSKQAVEEALALIGPKRISEIEHAAAMSAAESLTAAGFGKFKAEVRFSSRDDTKKVYHFTLALMDATKKPTDFSRDQHTQDVTLAYDSETKKLLKQRADCDQKIEGVEQELLEVKTQFARLDEWVEEKKALLAVRQLSTLEDGQAQLEMFLGKDVVAEMLHQANA